MAEFLGGKCAQELEPALDLLRCITEGTEFLLIAPGSRCRIRNAPMRDMGLTWKDRTRFLGLIANSDDDVRARIYELVP